MVLNGDEQKFYTFGLLCKPKGWWVCDAVKNWKFGRLSFLISLIMVKKSMKSISLFKKEKWAESVTSSAEMFF